MKYLFFCSVLMFSTTSISKTITLMNYNVENLFDTAHDEGKQDYTYLPYSVKKKSKKIQKYCKSLSKRSWRKSCLYTDWNKNVLNSKLSNIAKVLTSFNNGGADIIVLQEVENERVLKMLMSKLNNSDYKYYSILEGPDLRGIDNGVISKYPIKKSILHKVDLRPVSKSKTRDILEVSIDIDGKELKIFANHWPSQGAPSTARNLAAQTLVNVSKNSQADLTIALGDFNTLKKDKPHGIQEHVLEYYYDAHVEALKEGTVLREGSHWYKGHWSRLDRLFILKNSKAEVDYRTFEIFSEDFMFTAIDWTDYNTGDVTVYEGVPFRFDQKSLRGFSDHLPLVVKLTF